MDTVEQRVTAVVIWHIIDLMNLIFQRTMDENTVCERMMKSAETGKNDDS